MQTYLPEMQTYEDMLRAKRMIDVWIMPFRTKSKQGQLLILGSLFWEQNGKAFIAISLGNPAWSGGYPF